jgi:mxaJ protein
MFLVSKQSLLARTLSRFLLFAALMLVSRSAELDGLSVNPATGKRILRITCDPNNLPFSNERLEGFENKIAELIAHDVNAEIHYAWRAQRRGFFRETLKAGECDLILAVPTGFERALTTRPYYRSSYVFVSRKESALSLRSFTDQTLRSLRIGVQLVGDDGVNTPPAHALAEQGIITNLVGFTLYGDYSEPNPPARIIDAVANGTVDLAVVWGPLGGYFSKRAPVPLMIQPVDDPKLPGLRFTFAISMGVKRGNAALKEELDTILQARKPEIDAILEDYGVPRVEKEKTEKSL